MELLLSNDDGVNALGLEVLARELQKIASVTVIAPDRDRSGASNSLTLDRPLKPSYHENGFISLSGTPTDCVYLGIYCIVDKKPERVVSGINAGANLGDDVLYSGTVAAAMEGRRLPRPSIAVSLVRMGMDDKMHYETAAIIVRRLLEQADTLALSPKTVLNINVPNLPLNEIKGIDLTRLGHRSPAETPHVVKDPRGDESYWLSGSGKEDDGGVGTDFHAVSKGRVSITPMQFDMSHYESFDHISSWLGDCNLL
ncbi:MAG: 5'/3'-nucleotidase SurE [Pseudomonadales bacterium]|jgi:5'-nucleotidase|nr:5'/3'-nucleotidase SurE [Pseudomonadales bacterium]